MTKQFQEIRGKSCARISPALGLTALILWAGLGMATPVQWVELPNAGIDSDYDGVRDDVSAEIRKRYTLVRERRWPMEIARAGQRHVTSDGNPFSIYRAQAEMQRALRCLSNSNGQAVSESLRDEILGLVLNTDSRRNAYANSVALWEDDIRHRDLPSRPDDRWQDSCGDNRAITHVVRRDVKRPAIEVVAEQVPAAKQSTLSPSFRTDVVTMEQLPAPNFFLTGEIPEIESPVVTRELSPEPKRETLSSDPQPFSSDTSLPDAFRVKPDNQVDRLSTSFRFDEGSDTRAGTPVVDIAIVEAMPVSDEIVKTAETPVEQTVSPDQHEHARALRLFNAWLASESDAASAQARALELSDQAPASQVEVPSVTVVEDTEVLVEASESTAKVDSKHSNEIVVIVKKGNEGGWASSNAAQPTDLVTLPDNNQKLAGQAIEPALPDALMDLAPFIKNFHYK